jgi:hypothetical protein|tara:strand:- start:299 stop:574 length:276 start_codon:yes stop_codon:yes gene_type:complete
VPVLPREASYGEFRDYVAERRGPLSCAEIDELWERRQKLLTLRVDTGAGWRSRVLADDEQDLSRRELGDKRLAEAKSQGRNVERLPEKAHF